jgi:hypothetical protein
MVMTRLCAAINTEAIEKSTLDYRQAHKVIHRAAIVTSKVADTIRNVTFQ